jgi:predicted phage replisome organizer
MADVKWIKMATNIFDNRKIRLIESLPDGDAIIVIWMKLLCLAGNINDSGMVYFTKEIPYTEQMMATQFNRPLATVQMAMKTFEQFGMIEIVNDILHISNWEKYQNIEGMDKIREQNRIRKQKQRERQKLLLEENSHVTSRDSHVTEEDKEEEKNKIRIEEDKERINYQKIINMYNDTCVSFPKITKLSDSRKKAIKARLNTYSYDDFQKLFNKAEASDFLKGKNSRDWQGNFDWLIKDSNMAKTLDGNYDNKSTQKQQDENNEDKEFLDFIKSIS